MLEEVRILNAADLMTTDFACAFDKTLSPIKMVRSLNTQENVLILKPVDGKMMRFKDIRMIKYGDSSKEANLCDRGFGYKTKTETISEDVRSIKLELEPFIADQFVKNVFVDIELLNDDGLIHMEIYQDGDTSYVPEDVYQPVKNVATKKLTDFMSYDAAPLPFIYTFF